MKSSLRAYIRRMLSNKKYEPSENGVLIGSDLDLGAAWKHQFLFGPSFDAMGPDVRLDQNKIVDQGLILAIVCALANGAKVPTWYLVPFKNNATPQSNWTGANIAANSGEFTNYTEAQRPAFVFPDPTTIATPSIANTDMAVTTIGSGADTTLYGGSLASVATKLDASATTKLFASVKFAAARQGLQAGDGIGWQYQLTAASA